MTVCSPQRHDDDDACLQPPSLHYQAPRAATHWKPEDTFGPRQCIKGGTTNIPHHWLALLAMSTLTSYPLISLPLQLSAALKEETDRHLENIIRANITSCCARSSPHLADFRLAIADKDVKEDSTLSDFRRLVPLTDYEAYRPWLDKFMERPCKLSEVENLLAPGLPSYFGVSSSTSGSKPKHFARYSESNSHFAEQGGLFGPSLGLTAAVFSLSYRDIVDVTTESGEVLKRIPVCIGTAGMLRTTHRWPVETDNTRMTYISEYLFGQIPQ